MEKQTCTACLAHLQVLLQELCIALALADVEVLDALHIRVPGSHEQLGVLWAHTRDVCQALGQALRLSLP